MSASKTTLKQAQKKLEASVKKKEDKNIQKMYAKNVLQARGGMERLMKHKVTQYYIRPRYKMYSTLLMMYSPISNSPKRWETLLK